MKHAEFANGLRQIADFLEAHPEILLPEPALNCYGVASKEMAGTVARALSHGERCKKVFDGDLLSLQRTFGGITLNYYALRSNVCERVKVEEKVIPAHTLPAREEIFVPETVEEVFEWKCPDSLLASAK